MMSSLQHVCPPLTQALPGMALTGALCKGQRVLQHLERPACNCKNGPDSLDDLSRQIANLPAKGIPATGLSCGMMSCRHQAEPQDELLCWLAALLATAANNLQI